MPARYRAEQVGSLLRPAELLQARAAFAESKISLEELRAKEDHAIAQAFELHVHGRSLRVAGSLVVDEQLLDDAR